jgi:hypothetical protein
MLRKPWVFSAVLFVIVALTISGCASPTPAPTPTPRPTIADTPMDAVVQYWQAIDKGDYDTAFDLAHPTQNVTRQQWVDHHRAAWGDNGTSITIHSFNVTGTTPLDPNTFPGNFTAIESVIVETDVSYYGKETTGISQFAAVKEADDGWKFYGSY